MKKLVVAKRASQAVFLSMFVYILWSTTYPLTGPVSPQLLFKADPLLVLATAVSERAAVPGIAWALAMCFLTLVAGRFFCGWMCPLGSLIDMAGAEKKDRPLSDKRNRRLRRVKYWLLACILAAAGAGIQLAWLFDPVVIFGRFVSLNLIPAITFAFDAAFSSLIRGFHLYGPVYDLYRYLKTTILGVQVRYVAHAAAVFAYILSIVIAADLLKRSWCRICCPLGALYGLIGRFTLLERSVDRCSHCGNCSSSCRMGAITKDAGYVKSECILCMDCVYDCPSKGTRFGFPLGPEAGEIGGSSVNRRQFLALGLLSLPSLLGFRVAYPGRPGSQRRRVIRPPAALEEEEFLNRCVRCGNCMKVCVTNGLQPAFLESGIGGIWTPHLVPEIGYCEYHCTLCGSVCPTGAIPRLTEEQKLKTRLGIARIDRSLCLPWIKKQECLVCEEHCPIASKAIQLRPTTVNGKALLRPYINERLCIGCGICQTKCPVRPDRAIKIYPVRVTRGIKKRQKP
ncbi:MAG TPA: 4Fe-4S binding protein [Candidatus Omnitrophota bacterium]|nr:4Fe-4S binding protein [Candidatus Omnitrophota bacterium]